MLASVRGESVRCPSDEEIRSFCFMTGGGPMTGEDALPVLSSTSSRSGKIHPDGHHSKGTLHLDSCREMTVAYGRVRWESKVDEEPRCYVRVPVQSQGQVTRLASGGRSANGVEDCGIAELKSTNPLLLRFLLENVWSIGRARVLITVTGGAVELDLDAENREELLRGVMEAVKSVGGWCVTGGTNKGIMKCMGEARVLYASQIPLIGIATWGVVKGRDSMQMNRDLKLPVRIDDMRPVGYERACSEHQRTRFHHASPTTRAPPAVELDENHSHFVLAHDGSQDSFGREIDLRAELEACIADGRECSRQIAESLERQGLGWPGLNVRGVMTAKPAEAIPIVCIVVQGGVGTLDTVHQALRRRTPVLFINGTGRIADLLADTVTVSNPEKLKIASMPLEKTSAIAANTARAHHLLSVLNTPDAGIDAYREVLAMYSEQDGALADDKIEKLRWSLRFVIEHLHLCWVYDLNRKNESDLKGSILNCILNPMEPSEELETMLMLAIRWEKPDILRRVLERSERTAKWFLKGTEAALVVAMSRNKPDCVQVLIEFGADIADLAVDRQYFRKSGPRDHTDMHWRRTRQAWKWRALMHSAKEDQKAKHVLPLISQARKELEAKDGKNGLEQSLLRSSGQVSLSFKKSLLNMISQEAAAYEPDVKRQELTIAWRHGHRLTYSELKKKRLVAKQRQLYWGAKKMFRTGAASEDDLDLLYHGLLTNVVRMDRIYSRLLGPSWRYSYGMMDRTWDVFLWAVLMNRQRLARIAWEKVEQPVVAALTACMLYRKMAVLPHVGQEVAAHMRDNADEFEQIAIQVHQLSMDADMSQAVEALEIPRGLWAGLTDYDLAVKSDSKEFLLKCCIDPRDQRWLGDLVYDPYVLLNLVPFYLAVILSVFTLGLLAPYTFEYNLPPKSRASRNPAQRRPIPLGFPDKPLSNPILRLRLWQHNNRVRAALGKLAGWTGVNRAARLAGKISGLHKEETKYDLCSDLLGKLVVSPNEIYKLTHDQQSALWAPTFGYYDRWKCFWAAPVTQFTLGATFFTTFVVFFTWVLTTIEEDAEELSQVEYVVAFWMLGSLLMELRQVAGEGVLAYISDFWNNIDGCILVLFWAAFALRHACLDRRCTFLFLYDYDSSPQPLEELDHKEAQEIIKQQLMRNIKGLQVSKLARQLYGMSIFFCWLRLLHLYSVNRTLGLLVLVLRRMTDDIITFVFIWAVLLMAFAAALLGGQLSQASMCEAEDQGDGPVFHVKCWEIWFLNEINDPVSVVMFMLLLLLLQLVLNNTVFVAVVTATFQTVWDQTEAEWTIEIYNVTEENMRYSRAVPVPLNILLLPLDLVLTCRNQSRVAYQDELEFEAGLPETSQWRKHSRLTHARFAGVDIVPRELQDEQSAQLDDSLEDAELKERRRRELEEDGKTLRRVRALQELSRASFIAQERAKERARSQMEELREQVLEVRTLATQTRTELLDELRSLRECLTCQCGNLNRGPPAPAPGRPQKPHGGDRDKDPPPSALKAARAGARGADSEAGSELAGTAGADGSPRPEDAARSRLRLADDRDPEGRQRGGQSAAAQEVGGAPGGVLLPEEEQEEEGGEEEEGAGGADSEAEAERGDGGLALPGSRVRHQARGAEGDPAAPSARIAGSERATSTGAPRAGEGLGGADSESEVLFGAGEGAASSAGEMGWGPSPSRTAASRGGGVGNFEAGEAEGSAPQLEGSRGSGRGSTELELEGAADTAGPGVAATEDVPGAGDNRDGPGENRDHDHDHDDGHGYGAGDAGGGRDRSGSEPAAGAGRSLGVERLHPLPTGVLSRSARGVLVQDF